ncbi:S-layer homology domain-containing protein [Paenibacillus pinistramenti]|uniref:S-layer homology domain-containing protein n=1 Tax=Paenibacillus pinistramenti TaxID=1768003 RepID=UPI001108167B|nr:S-layer homology domain-containing protein [Paenibacillus pinistramenti]
MQNTDDQEVKGRVFANYLSLNMGKNSVSLKSVLYILTKDGFQYKTDMNGIDPYGFIFFSNNRGYIDSDGKTLYHSVPIKSNVLPDGITVQDPSMPDSDTDVTHRVFLNEPASDLPSDVPVNPVLPPTPVGFAFSNSSNSGSLTAVGTGGTFQFTTSSAATYQLILDTDGVTGYDPSSDTVIESVSSEGLNKVVWNGKDRNGNSVPAGTYKVKLTIKGGEYHFPMLDVENAPNGVKITMLNNPTAFPDGLTASTVYYDDSDYTTASGTKISLKDTSGNIGVSPANASSGIESGGTTGAHGFSNNFGNDIAMDTWTYFPGPSDEISLTVTNTQTAGVLFDDTNNNGVQDEEESGLAGVPVKITDAAGNVLTPVTGSDGSYSAPVLPGQVWMEADPSDTLNGYTITTAGKDQQTLTAKINETGTFDPVGYVVNTAPRAESLSIAGTLKVGKLVNGLYSYRDTNGDLEGDSVFLWYRGLQENGSDKVQIAGADSDSYQLTKDDYGKYIFFQVTPAAQTGVLIGEPAVSAGAGPVGDNSPTAGLLSITGGRSVGSTFVGNYTFADEDDDQEGQSLYQWYRASQADGSDKQLIPGATSKTYTAGQEDLGQYLFFQVTPVAQTGTQEGTPVLFGPSLKVVPVAPTAPLNVQADQTGQTDTYLSWEPVNGADSYTVYRDGTEIAAGLASPSYHAEGLSPLTSYEFTVIAVNEGGESPASIAALVKTLPYPPESGITLSLNGTTDEGTADLQWNTVTGATYYNLYQDGVRIADSVTDVVYGVTGLMPDVTYTFEVTAANDGGESQPSNPVEVLILSRSAAIEGTVYSSTGGTVAGLTVQLLDDEGSIIDETLSDEQGHYRFEQQAPQDYTLAVSIPSKLLASEQVTLQNRHTLQQDVTLPETAVLQLTADPSRIVGDGVSTSTLTASLTTTDGTPLQDVPVVFEASAGSLAQTELQTSTEGTAQTVLTAPLLQGITPATEGVTVTVRDMDQGIFAEQAISIVFQPASITGVVVHAGQPIAGAKVSVAEDFDADGVIDFQAETVTDSEGKYTIVVPRGNWTYKLNIQAPLEVGGSTILVDSEQSVQVGTLSGAGEKFTADRQVSGLLLVGDQNSDAVQSISQVLAAEESVSGTLYDSNGQPLDAEVEVTPEGSFKVKELAPGNYKILFQVTSADGQKLAGSYLNLNVQQNGELAVEDALIDPYGKITDTDTGAPIEGVQMKLYWADTPLNRSKGRQPGTLVDLPERLGFAPNQNHNPQATDALGDYAWLVYSEGDYYITASKDGYNSYDSRTEGRNTAALPGEDSYVSNGIIHVGQSLVAYSLSLTAQAAPSTDNSSSSVSSGSSGSSTVQPSPSADATAPELESHLAYIKGYPDGLFRPERGVTRAEVAAVFARLLKGTLDVEYTGLTYRDVHTGMWARNYISVVTEAGLMRGGSDGLFRPNDHVTRAELAAIMVRYKQLAVLKGNAFTDTEGHWAQDMINTAKTAGLIKGYSDSTFKPDNDLTRAEFVTAVNRMIGRGPLLTPQSWSDVPTSYWAYGDIEEASKPHSSAKGVRPEIPAEESAE